MGGLDFLINVFFFLAFVGVYALPGGLAYSRADLWLKRNTQMDGDVRRVLAISIGAVWPVMVPWFMMWRTGAVIDPEVRKQRAMVENAETMRLEAAHAERRAELDRAKVKEETALRALDRARGEEVPRTAEEQLDLERAQARAMNERAQAESAMLTVRQRAAETERYEVENQRRLRAIESGDTAPPRAY